MIPIQLQKQSLTASEALPPAFRMTCASPSASPREAAGSIRASMHVLYYETPAKKRGVKLKVSLHPLTHGGCEETLTNTIATLFAGGAGSWAFSPNEAAYFSFEDCMPGRIEMERRGTGL